MTAYVVQQVLVGQRRHYESKGDISTADRSRLAILVQQVGKLEAELAIP
jgi:hypothetical protein